MLWLERFIECTRGGWITAGKDVQYKVVDRVLYFQCSSGKSDWKQNFRFAESVYSGGDIEIRAHRGFKELWLSVKDVIETLEFDSIVGYSQGAALAGFAHENYFHRKGFEPCMTHAFGCPRFLFKPSKELKARFIWFVRINNPTDLVTKVPLWIMGYKHVGMNVVLKDVANKPEKESLLSWLSGHSPSRYKQNLGVL